MYAAHIIGSIIGYIIGIGVPVWLIIKLFSRK